MPRFTPVLASGLALVGLVYACTGDDPAVANENGSSTSSGGSSSGGSSSGSSGTSGALAEAGPTSCLGKPFTLKPITPGKNADAGISKPWLAETIRPLGGSATEVIFAAHLDSTRGDQLFRATWNKSSEAGPLIGDDAIEIVQTDASEDVSDRWPTLARSVTPANIFLVWEHASLGSNKFNLRINTKQLGDKLQFGGEMLLDMKGGDVNERTPWLAGLTTRALYWSRSLNGTAFRVIRSDVVLDASGTKDASFGDAKFVVLTCPGGETRNCDTPVVAPDERTMLFSTNDTIGDTPGVFKNVQAFETVLDGTTHDAVGEPIPHPEVAQRYPTWISDDGCEAIFANETGSAYAKR